MEIRQYYLLFRKWVWLLALGTILGGASTYLISRSQQVVYQTSTRMMVSSASDNQNQSYNYYYDSQLVKTYAQIINSQPITLALSERLGYPVSGGQIQVRQIPDSTLIQLSVTDNDPQHAADIANSVVQVFVEYNQSLLDERYKSTEESLKAQIDQIEGQIATLQTEMSQASETTQESQKQQIEEQTKQIEAMLATVEDEIVSLETNLETFIPTPAVTNTPAPSWHIPTSTPVPVATPTLSQAAQVKYKEMQIRKEQLDDMRTLFQQAYGNLLVLQQSSSTDPALRQSQLQTTTALYQQIYSNLLSSYENVRLARLRSTPNISQVEPAEVPSRPIRPQPVRNGVLGALSGLMIMGAIAFLVEYLDDSLKTSEDVSHHLNLSVLGLIGEMDHPKRKKGDKKVDPGIYVMKHPLSAVSEGFRNLRTNLDFASVDKSIKTLIVTSSGPSEGKSTVSVNLAAVIAQGGRKTLLLDADLRRPSIHRYLGISNRKGLVDLFRPGTQLSDVITVWEEPPMLVIPCGELPPNPTELLASDRMEKIMEELKGIVDIIIIDTPPAVISDAVALSAKVDGVLVVIEPGATSLGSAQVMMEQFKRSGARVVGAVLNPISRRNSHYYTKYQYYSSYYYGSRGYKSYTDGNGESKQEKKGETR